MADQHARHSRVSEHDGIDACRGPLCQSDHGAAGNTVAHGRTRWDQPGDARSLPPARIAWIRAHDAIESGLGIGGDYQSVRDVAAKAVENVARLAALFHVLAHGPTGSVGVDAIEGALSIVRWHLHEARRLLADLDTPPALAAAIRLDTWLLSEARSTGSVRIPTMRVYQYGPACVRDSRDLKTALSTLTERGRARMEEVGRRRYVVVNPALVEGASVKSRE